MDVQNGKSVAYVVEFPKSMLQLVWQIFYVFLIRHLFRGAIICDCALNRNIL